MKISIFKKYLLLAFLFNTFSLEAKDANSKVNIEPMTRSNIWQMVSVRLNNQKYPLWGVDNCSPKVNGKCKQKHSHSGSLGNYVISDLDGMKQGPMIFSSESACNIAGNKMRDFNRSIPVKRHVNHSHPIKGSSGPSSHQHNSLSGLQRVDIKFICFESSTIDFPLEDVSKATYMNSAILRTGKYPYSWDSDDCTPKKENGTCRTSHSHTSGFSSYNSNEIEPLYLVKFSSRDQCVTAGDKIKSFMRNIKLNGTHQHSHGQDSSHNHTINSKWDLNLKYSCINAKGY